MKKYTLKSKNIEITEEELAELNRQAESKGLWIPEKGEEYFSVVQGFVSQYDWDDHWIALENLAQGKVFKTKEEAEQHCKYLEALADVLMYIHEHDLAIEPDWEDDEQGKWYVYYEHEKGIFRWSSSYVSQDLVVLPYLKSSEHCRQLIKDKEEQLKIIFNM